MLQKYKLLLVPEPGKSPGVDVARQWAVALPDRVKGVSRIEFDPLDLEGQATHDRGTGRSVSAPKWQIIVSLWASAVPESLPVGFTMIPIVVEDRIGYGFESDRPGIVPGYKKMSFWKAKDGLSRSFWDPPLCTSYRDGPRSPADLALSPEHDNRQAGRISVRRHFGKLVGNTL